MDITSIKDGIAIGSAVFAVLGSIIGGVLYLNANWNLSKSNAEAIKENRKLREEDKKETMKHIDELGFKIQTVENETRLIIEKINKELGEMNKQLTRIGTIIELYIEKHGKKS